MKEGKASIGKKLNLNRKAQMVILILALLFFSYEIVFSFFFRNEQATDVVHLRQLALLQFSFLIGILIKILSPETDLFSSHSQL